MTMRMNRQDVRLHLLREFATAPHIVNIEDYWEDVLLVKLSSGQTAAIYLLDRIVDLEEIRAIFIRNTAEKLHTLFILWSEMLVPRDGEVYKPEDWMFQLQALYGGKVYAYLLHERISIFPVYLDGTGPTRTVRYGDSIEVNYLGCEVIHTPAPYLEGGWHIADFVADRTNANPHAEQTARQQHQSDASAKSERTQSGPSTKSNRTQPPRSPLPPRPAWHTAYKVLGLTATTDRATIRRAYRQLARQYHPDVSNSPHATTRMQEINVAYTKIMAHLDTDS